MSTLGLLGKSSDSLLLFLKDLKFDKPLSKYIIKKIMNIAIRCTYYYYYYYFSFFLFVYAQFVEVLVVAVVVFTLLLYLALFFF